MAGRSNGTIPTPAPFKPVWDNPERNLFLYDAWVEAMGHYFLLSRRRNPNGNPIDWPDDEKMALALLAGGHEIKSLFEVVAGQVVTGNNQVTFEVATTAARTALTGRLNQTAQVYALHKMEQGSQTFGSWYPKVMEAAKRIDWDEYNLNVAARNVLVLNCESDKLRQKAIAENLGYEDVVRTGLAMENSIRKVKDMTSEEKIRSLEDQVRKLDSGNKKEKGGNNKSSKDRCKTCNRAPGHPKGQTCFALNLTCHNCGKKGHLQAACQQRKTGAEGGRKTDRINYVTYSDDEDDTDQEEVVRKIMRKIKKSKKEKNKRRTAKETSQHQSESESDSSVGRITESGGPAKSSPQPLAESECPPLVSSEDESSNSSGEESEVESESEPDIVRNVTQQRVLAARIKMNGKEVELTVDSGVKRNLINWQDWQKIESTTSATRTDRRFTPYGMREELPVRVKAAVTLKATNGAKVDTEVFIVESREVDSLLGRDDALRLGIIKLCPEGEKRAVEIRKEVERRKNEVAWLKLAKKLKMEESDQFSDGRNQAEVDQDIDVILARHPKLFQGLGKVKGQEVDVQLKAGATPKIQPRRPVPIHYTEKLKKKIEELKREGVIEGPLSGPLEPGSYVSNPVITAKRWSDEEIRLNLDLSDANEDIVMSHHPIPTPEELRHELREADTFTSIDANQMFQQWLIARNKRKLFTFRTPWGLYRYLRLPSGVNCAGQECNNNLRAIVEGLEGIIQIADDIVVFGEGRIHDQRLEKLLRRLEKWGITLRKEKCHWGRPEILWFGKVYSKAGVSIDPAKTEVIRNLEPPKSAKEVRSFLQMAQFNSEFLHPRQDGKGKQRNYAELTKPLRDAANAGTRFKWTTKQQEAFERIKELMASDKILEHFHPDRPTKVYVDFSDEGISGTLAQGRTINAEEARLLKAQGARVDKISKEWVEWRPVTHVSRSLEKSEKNYSSVEGESLAVLYGVWRLRRYLWGTKFMVAGDHKPLLPHYNGKKVSPHRVTYHKMKLQGFNFDLVWEPGPKNPTDYPSRHPMERSRQSNKEEEEHCCDEEDVDIVSAILQEEDPEAISLKTIKKMTKMDTVLSQVKEAIQARKPCPPGNQYRPFTKVYDELTVEHGVVVRGQRVVVPQGATQDCIELAHRGHQGPAATLAALRDKVWFPGMKASVDGHVETCLPCQAAEPGTKTPPMKISDLPEGAWNTVHSDYKGKIGGQFYLHVCIDGYSRFAEVDITKSTGGEELMPKLDRIWATHGIPQKLITDNGPPYRSHEFERYCKRMGIEHIPITETHSQSNAIAERFMRRLVKMTLAASAEGKDPRREVYKFVLNYNNSVHSSTGRNPAELLMRRKVKTLLPQLPQRKREREDKEVRKRDKERKEYNKKKYDKRKRVVEQDIQIGDRAMIKQKKTTVKPPWDPNPYTVDKISKERLYMSRGDGKTRRRHVGDVKIIQARRSPPKGRVQREREEDSDIDIDVNNIRNHYRRITAGAAPAEPPGPQVLRAPPAPPGPLPPPPPPPRQLPLAPVPRPPPPGQGNPVQVMKEWEDRRGQNQPHGHQAEEEQGPHQVRQDPTRPPTIAITRAGREIRRPRKYGETSEEEERDTSQELNQSMVPSDPEGVRAISPTLSDRTLSWDGLQEPAEYQLNLDHNCSARINQIRPPPGLLHFDEVFWGEDEEYMPLEARKVPKPSPRQRRRIRSKAKSREKKARSS